MLIFQWRINASAIPHMMPIAIIPIPKRRFPVVAEIQPNIISNAGIPYAIIFIIISKGISIHQRLYHLFCLNHFRGEITE